MFIIFNSLKNNLLFIQNNKVLCEDYNIWQNITKAGMGDAQCCKVLMLYVKWHVKVGYTNSEGIALKQLPN